MDGTRFDELARSLGRSVSRRTALKGAIAALASRSMSTPAQAAQQTCPILEPCAQESGIACVTLQATDGECLCAFRPMTKAAICTRAVCVSDSECPADQRCATGWCDDGLGRCHSLCAAQGDRETCLAGNTRCGSRCVNLASDIWNCGACGHQCEFGGDQPAEICVEGQCVCPPEYTGTCGQGYCTNEQIDRNNCGSCGNTCGTGALCCSGRCVSRQDAERFCDWCGYLGGWPQGCLADEVCDRGVCVPGSAPAGEAAQDGERTDGTPTGDLAYSVKNGGHWNIWVHHFDTGQNTQLTNEPNSDQWAPAYSHDGTRLAYLSDQTDGTNQIWLMNPDGSGKWQLTNWYGAEQIIYAGWSPDDSRLIVTLFGDTRRLVTMPATGGSFTNFIDTSSSFASTSPNGLLAYSWDDGTPATTIYLANFASPPGSPFAAGDTPDLSRDGAYLAVQIGDPGNRHIETYPTGANDQTLPAIPRLGDDSNPVWLTPNHTYLAFVSAGSYGEAIQMCAVDTGIASPVEIAAHDRVWYLSKRFSSESSAQPAAASSQASEQVPATSPATAPDVFYTSPQYGYRISWTSVWEEQPQYSGQQDDGSERLVLWHTGQVVATVDLRASALLPADLEVCVSEAIDTLEDEKQFADNVVPSNAPALTPTAGAAGRTAWNFLQRDYLYTYIECRALSNGSGTLRIAYQVTDDAYARIYPDIVALLGMIEA